MNKAVRNERRKISATYVNGVAIALVAVGGFAPAASLIQTGQMSFVSSSLITICVLISGALHLVARRLLRSMEE